MSGTTQMAEIKTVVLVHGAFADGSSYAKVIPLLTAKGLKAIAVQNPLSSLADDVKAVKRTLSQQVRSGSAGRALLGRCGDHRSWQ